MSTSAIGYQAGPTSAMVIATIAPSELNPTPTTPRIIACRIGLRGASRTAM